MLLQIVINDVGICVLAAFLHVHVDIEIDICTAVPLIQTLLIQKSGQFRQVIMVPAELIVFTLLFKATS